MRVLVFDTETTGLPDTWDKSVTDKNLNLWPHIVQLSYIIFDTDKLQFVELYDAIIKINEDVIVSEGSLNLHKITKEISHEKGKDLVKVMLDFFDAVNTVEMLIGHNINFDLNMVCAAMLRNKTELQQYSVLFDSKKKFCTMKESTAFCCFPSNYGGVINYNKLKPPKLVELYQKLFNETPSGLHNSLNDVIATLRCFIKLRYDKDITSTT